MTDQLARGPFAAGSEEWTRVRCWSCLQRKLCQWRTDNPRGFYCRRSLAMFATLDRTATPEEAQ